MLRTILILALAIQACSPLYEADKNHCQDDYDCLNGHYCNPDKICEEVQVCSQDPDCPTGRYCEEARCNWDCQADADCAQDQHCDDRGRCADDCLPKDSTRCTQNVTYWVDSCGNLEEVAETCECGCAPDQSSCHQTCECTSAADCAPGWYCDLAAGECRDVTCTPECEGKCCGDDGCGGQCPDTCQLGTICNTSTCACDNEECCPDLPQHGFIAGRVLRMLTASPVPDLSLALVDAMVAYTHSDPPRLATTASDEHGQYLTECFSLAEIELEVLSLSDDAGFDGIAGDWFPTYTSVLAIVDDQDRTCQHNAPASWAIPTELVGQARALAGLEQIHEDGFVILIARDALGNPVGGARLKDHVGGTELSQVVYPRGNWSSSSDMGTSGYGVAIVPGPYPMDLVVFEAGEFSWRPILIGALPRHAFVHQATAECQGPDLALCTVADQQFCVNTQDNHSHCGSCNTHCGPQEFCRLGQCEFGCYSDTDCPMGSWCWIAECVSDCFDDDDCAPDFYCTERGRCQEHACGESVTVVVTAENGTHIPGAHVSVTDSVGQSYAGWTSAGGVIILQGLAGGPRQAITVYSDEQVPALPGSGDATRARYEATTILDICTKEITIPLRLTASGEAFRERGVIAGHIPGHLWDLLPHSWKCEGVCASDADCDGTYYCEQEPNACYSTCTPRSLLPFFGLGDPYISGQFRFAMLLPVEDTHGPDRFRLSSLLPGFPSNQAMLPSNMATDDTFLNGIAATFGIDPFGQHCVTVNDCPNQENPRPDYYRCEEDPNGDHRCKLKSPLATVRQETLTSNVRHALVMGLINIDFLKVLPGLLNIMTGGGDFGHSLDDFLGSWEMRTLVVCPFVTQAAPGVESDITPILESLNPQDCWKVEYSQASIVQAIVNPAQVNPDNTCLSDFDCDWPSSGLKCLSILADPNNDYCLMPLFREMVTSGQGFRVEPLVDGFDPGAPNADSRLRAGLPDAATHEVLCDGPGGLESCDPPVYCGVPVAPETTDCSYPYQLLVASLEFPDGHPLIPEGGLIHTGFMLERSLSIEGAEGYFMVPQIPAATMHATRLYFRNAPIGPDRSFVLGPGSGGTSVTVTDYRPEPVPMLPSPGLFGGEDTGLSVEMLLDPDDPRADCDTVVFNQIRGLGGSPLPGLNDLPDSVGMEGVTSDLFEIVVSKVESPHLTDNVWRVYTMPGAAMKPLQQPPGLFSSGEEVWVTTEVSGFDDFLDLDTFPTTQILRHKRRYSSDSFAFIVP